MRPLVRIVANEHKLKTFFFRLEMQFMKISGILIMKINQVNKQKK